LLGVPPFVPNKLNPFPIYSHAAMPIGFVTYGFTEGLSQIPYGWTALKLAIGFGVLYLLKWFFNGAINGSERNMHSKVIMVTVSGYGRGGSETALT
jgi:hypothetical protein